MIRRHGLDMIYLSGPGHGAPGVLAPTYLDGSYSEIYPDKSQDLAGLGRFLKQFSFPGHIGSHCTPETPGSIHEGGELGYVLSHACGAVFDNPDLIALACVGDGEAETGPLATSWHINKFLNPISDGAVLPVLHLNGYKIANPTLLARIPKAELESLLRGYGWSPLFVEGHEPEAMHAAMASAMESAITAILAIRRGGPPHGGGQAAGLAPDRAALPQGLDRPGRPGRPEAGGLLALPPGAPAGPAPRPGPAAATRRLAQELPALGAVRRGRPPGRGAPGPRAPGAPADGLQSPRQWRPAAPQAAAGPDRRLRRGRRGPGPGNG